MVARRPDDRLHGQPRGTERSIYFVYLQKAEEETDDRDRAEQRAVEKLRKARLRQGSGDRRCGEVPTGGRRRDRGRF